MTADNEKDSTKTKEATEDTDLDLDDDDDLTPPLPPDGGWGWVVAIASFLTNLIVDGTCYTFSVIYNDLLETFEAGKAETALVGALVPGVYLLVGPIVGALANKFGCKIVAVIGSLIAAIFFVVSAFSTSIVMMQLTYGVMGGVGFGLMYLPSIVMVGHYFDKKRALATGIAVCGSGMGTFVFAPLGSFLVREYGWRGANIIMGAIILHGIAFGGIYRPLEENRKRKKGLEPRKSRIMETIAEEKKRVRQMSVGSTNGVVITSDNEVIIVNNNRSSVDESADIIATPQNKYLLDVKDNNYTGSKASVGSKRSHPGGSSADLKKELAKPFTRSDVLYTGSVTNLPEYKTQKDMTSYVQSIISLPKESDSKVKRALRIILEMFDFSLLKSGTFLVLAASGTLVFLGLYTPFVYVSQKAITQLGSTPEKASLILSVLGICNTVSRIFAGWLADRRWIDLLIIHNVSAILAGIATAIVPVLNSYELLCIYAAFFGVNIAAFIALRSVVFVEMLGLKKLNNAFGLTSLFQGIAVLIGSPLSGALLELTGSFTTSFVVCGVIIALGGVICLPVRKIAAWEKAREEREKEKKGIYKKVAAKEMEALGV